MISLNDVHPHIYDVSGKKVTAIPVVRKKTLVYITAAGVKQLRNPVLLKDEPGKEQCNDVVEMLYRVMNGDN